MAKSEEGFNKNGRLSLSHLSGSALQQILSFLTGEEVMTLFATGSKSLMALMRQNTKSLVFSFNRSTYFPFGAYYFPNLESLDIISCTGIGSNHLSTKGRCLLPQEPMKALISLNLNFATSARFLEPGDDARTMSSCFPNLTSLEVRSSSAFAPFGLLPGPREHPRQKFAQNPKYRTAEWTPKAKGIASCWFDCLPMCLQSLHIDTGAVHIVGGVNLLPFTKLRVLRLASVESGALPLLPDSVEEIHIGLVSSKDTKVVTVPTVRVSRLPPGIRVWSTSGCYTRFELKSMAPPTLEEISLEYAPRQSLLEQIGKKFFKKSLKKVEVHGTALEMSLMDIAPNLTSFVLPETAGVSELEVMAKLPARITDLDILPAAKPEVDLPSASNWPPTLKSLKKCVWNSQDLVGLPQSLSSLVLWLEEGTPRIPSTAWSTLPSQLKSMVVSMDLLESSECLHDLPETLEALHLFAGTKSQLAQMSFSKNLSCSLKRLVVQFPPGESNVRANGYAEIEFLTKLGNFEKLEVLHVRSFERCPSAKMRYDMLSKLPKSLTELEVCPVIIDNRGLPPGTGPSNSDWSYSLLAKLPEGLKSFTFIGELQSGAPINFKLFERFPKNLSSLAFAGTVDSCESLISVLPKRIARLSIRQGERISLEDLTSSTKLSETLTQLYYDSDPFWGDVKLTKTP